LPRGRLKDGMLKAIPDRVSRLMTNRCRMGTFLVSRLVKQAK
jgi:hypothetical protein